ncbi:O-antigen ligase family protein [Sphingomicrobium flavum]|uniref:O-antigen ligase family protein n=1 Tax=Sphingomicrobium flavum TaxID=1229164 RepID=UPI0021ADC746|nr:O-antigen ligase family protein [Sphingomicrobium flavum]
MGELRTSFVDRCILLAVALAPALFIALTFDHQQPRALNDLRSWAYPVLAVELLLIVAAILRSALVPTIVQLPRLARWLLLALVLLLALSAATAAASIPYAVARTAVLCIHLLAGLSLYALWNGPGGPSDRTVLTGLLSGWLCFLLIALAFIALAPEAGSFDWAFFGLGVQNIRSFASYCMMMSVLALGALLCLTGWRRALAAAVALIALALIFWSGSRGPALGWVAAWVAGILLVARPYKMKLLGQGSALLVAAAALSFVHQVPRFNFGLLRLLGIGMEYGPNGVTSGRTQIWATTIDYIARSPLFGYGVGQFRPVVDLPTRQPFPHNTVLQFLFNWGWVGGTIALILLGWLGLAVTRRARGAPGLAFCGFLLVASCFAFGVVDEPFFDVMPIYLFMLACVIALRGKENPPPTLN